MDSQLRRSSLLSPTQIGDVNRSRVLQALCDHGPMSRADLAKMAGVTRATIGNIVQALLDSGLIEEHEPKTGIGRVGKPGRPVWFGPRAGLSGAVAVAATSVQVALINARGEVLADQSFAIEGATISGAGLAGRVIEALREVLPADAEPADSRGKDELLGIGIAVPGVCDTSSGTVIGAGQLPRVAGTELVDRVAAALGHRVLLDNDSRAQSLGEKWFGEGRGVANFISVQTGFGLGVGIVLGGSVFRGRRGLTGELGHTCVEVDGALCPCGLRGCWETIATLPWLRAEAERIGLPGAAELDAGPLMALVNGGGETALLASALADRYADNLAVGLANLVQLLNPERLILHGGIVNGGDAMRTRIDNALRARCFPYLRSSVELVFSQLDQRATLLGAAGLVLSETFNLGT